jgi:hypothetical protein
VTRFRKEVRWFWRKGLRYPVLIGAAIAVATVGQAAYSSAI